MDYKTVLARVSDLRGELIEALTRDDFVMALRKADDISTLYFPTDSAMAAKISYLVYATASYAYTEQRPGS